MRPICRVNLPTDRQTDTFITTTGNMKAAGRLGVRTWTRACVPARIQRRILGALYKYGQLSVFSAHTVELNREKSEQARSADDLLQANSAINASSPPDSPSYVHHQSPPASLFARCPRRPHARSAPEAEWIHFNCATTKPHFGPGFGYVPPLGLLRGLGCLLCSYSH